MAIGNPVSLTSQVASKTISIIATASQTAFTVTGGYRINQLAVFRNGVRLVDSRDYEARDGATVTLLSAASDGDAMEFQVFDAFQVADTINPYSTYQTINGNLNITGIVTAATFSITDLDVRNITAVAATFTGQVTYEDVTNVDSIGIITARSGIRVTGGGNAQQIYIDTGVGNNSDKYTGISASQYASDTETEGFCLIGGGSQSSNNQVRIGGGLSELNSSTEIVFHTASDTTTRNGTERLRITGAGAVKIGNNPTEGAADADDLTIATSGNTGITIRSGTSNTGNLFFSDSTSGTGEFAGAVTYNHSTNELKFRSNTVENLILNSSGDVNITGITTATQLFEGSTRVATSGKAIAMALIFG